MLVYKHFRNTSELGDGPHVEKDIGWFYILALLDFEIIFEDKLKVIE